MARILKITLVDGRIFDLPLNEPRGIIRQLNHPENIGAAVYVAAHGFCVDPKAEKPKIIGPAMIKEIDLETIKG